MKRLLTTLLAALAAFTAMGVAAQPAADATPAQVEIERARISAERSAVESRYSLEEKNCYGKFSVNNCLNEARARRRVALGDLRRQDLSLNDAERKRRGAEQLKRIEEKSSPQKQEDAAQRRERAINDQRIREEKAAKKAEDAAEKEVGAKSRVQAQLGKEQTAADKAAGRAGKAASAAQAASQQQQKLKDAQERRERVEKKERERTKPAAKPLPVPP